MKIAFTTLACPAWSWDKILDEASRLGYDGIELRGLEGEMFLPKCPPFQPETIDQTLRQIESKGLEICCLDTSCSFHDPGKYEAAIAEGMASIDLAQKLSAPYIRVFGDAIPDPASAAETIKQVADAMERLGRYGEEKGVRVLLETHGDFAVSERVLAVVEQTSSPAVGVLWDINNPYKYREGESMEQTYRRLAKYIKHTHIKDTLGRGKDEQIRMAGQGDLPIVECLSILKENGYDGWLSFEWEKKWHPDIEEPEVALPAFIEYIKSHL